MEGAVVGLLMIGVSVVGYLTVDQLGRFSDDNRRKTFIGASRKRNAGRLSGSD